MKFVCDQCKTRYSIADDKVKQKILKIRCKACGNVITVQESSAVADDEPASAEAPSAPPARPSVAPPTPPQGPQIDWHLSVNGKPEGPLGLVALVKRVAALEARDEAYVWNDQMDGWKEPKDVPAVARELASLRAAVSRPPAPPRPAPPAAAPARPASQAAGATGTGLPSPPSAAAPRGLPGAALPAPSLSASARPSSLLANGAGAAPGRASLPASGAGGPAAPGRGSLPAPGSSLPAPGSSRVSTRLPSRPELAPVAPLAVSAPGLLDEDEGERTAIAPVSAAQLASLMGEAAPDDPPPSTDVSLDSTDLRLPPAPSGSAGTFSAPSAAPVGLAPSGRRSGLTGLEALDFGQPQAQPHLAETPPPIVLPATVDPVEAFLGSPVTVSGPRPAVVAPQPFFPPPPVTGPALSTGTGSHSQVSGLSGLSKVIPRPNIFARNPALKYGTFAAVLAGLIIVVVMLSLREPEKRPFAKVQGAASGVDEDPEAAARRLAAEQFRNQVGVAEQASRAEVASAPRRSALRGPAPARAAAAPTAVAPPPASLEPPPTAPSEPALEETGSVTRRFAQAERSISAASVQKAKAAAAAPSFNQSDVTAVVKRRENQDAIKICYERALKRDNRLKGGRLDVTVTIGSSGMVRAVDVDAPSDLNAVSSCVRDTVKRWRFPASNEEYGTSFPFVFQRDNSG